jgi:hypothetical protein
VRLDQAFVSHLAETDVALHNRLMAARDEPGAIERQTESELVWAEQFDGDIGDLFALQNEVTGRIAIALNVDLSRREAARPTENRDALDYLPWARAQYGTGPNRDAALQILSMYERALALDPHSVEAQSQVTNGLAVRAGQ